MPTRLEQQLQRLMATLSIPGTPAARRGQQRFQQTFSRVYTPVEGYLRAVYDQRLEADLTWPAYFREVLLNATLTIYLEFESPGLLPLLRKAELDLRGATRCHVRLRGFER